MLFTSISAFYPPLFNRNDIILLEYPIEIHPTHMFYRPIPYFILPPQLSAIPQPSQGNCMIRAMIG